MFFKKINEEELLKEVERALSRMEEYEIFDQQIVQELKNLYENDSWFFVEPSYPIFSDFPSVGVSTDFSSIKKVIVPKSKHAKEMAYISPFKAYLTSLILLALQKAKRMVKRLGDNSFELILVFEDQIYQTYLPSRQEMLNYASWLKKKLWDSHKPQSLYLADLTLREDEEKLMEFRSKFFRDYCEYLFWEEGKGIDPCLYLALNLEKPKSCLDLPSQSAFHLFDTIYSFALPANLGLLMLFLSSSDPFWIVPAINMIPLSLYPPLRYQAHKKIENYKKNLGRSIPQKRIKKF
ncbi:MAG: hypothetical protein DRP00_01170 [Candidatus Aenigmatarchaeota archaeon]|nr:MAG: hypothetical protein DRP00_01170 [Candidatus Aenigmarchaeota archaeon]